MAVATTPVGVRTIAPHQVTIEQLRNYFAIKPKFSFPGWAVLPFILGACGLFGTLGALGSPDGAGSAAGIGFFALLMLGLGGLGIYLAYLPIQRYNNRNTITDRSYDDWVEWQKRAALDQGGKRLGLDLTRLGEGQQVEADPLSIRGFERAPYWFPSTNQPYIIADYRVGDDGVWRYRRSIFIWFFQQPHQLGVYRSAVDGYDPGLVSNETQEYFYQAVSGLVTTQGRLNPIIPVNHPFLQRNSIVITATIFNLRIDNGDKVETPVVPEGHLGQDQSRLEETISTLRRLLRDKKQQMLPGQQPGNPNSGAFGPVRPSFEANGAGMGSSPGASNPPPPPYTPTGVYPGSGTQPGTYSPSGEYPTQPDSMPPDGLPPIPNYGADPMQDERKFRG